VELSDEEQQERIHVTTTPNTTTTTTVAPTTTTPIQATVAPTTTPPIQATVAPTTTTPIHEDINTIIKNFVDSSANGLDAADTKQFHTEVNMSIHFRQRDKFDKMEDASEYIATRNYP
jgi:Flp pilus assembly protein TadG